MPLPALTTELPKPRLRALFGTFKKMTPRPPFLDSGAVQDKIINPQASRIKSPRADLEPPLQCPLLSRSVTHCLFLERNGLRIRGVNVIAQNRMLKMEVER